MLPEGVRGGADAERDDGAVDELDCNLAAFIPKAAGGESGIGIIVSIYALYEQVRLDVIDAWAQSYERPYVLAGKGRGAEHCQWNVALYVEVALLQPPLSWIY